MNTDKQRLDWLSRQDHLSMKRHYQPFVDERTKKEIKTGGLNGRIDFFTCHSQHLQNCKNLRTAIDKAMAMKKIA